MKTRIRAAGDQSKGAVIGLDISLNATGVCIVHGDPTKQAGHGLYVRAKLIDVGKKLRGPERLSVVTNQVWRLVEQWRLAKPGALFVIEGYAYSASHAHSMGELGGCIRKTIWEHGGNILVVPPTTLKKFVTGKGNGDKNLMLKHVYKRWGYDAEDDNQCDAFACAVLGLLDTRALLELTKVEREILVGKVTRYAGKGQSWGGDIAPRKQRRRKTEIED